MGQMKQDIMSQNIIGNNQRLPDLWSSIYNQSKKKWKSIQYY